MPHPNGLKPFPGKRVQLSVMKHAQAGFTLIETSERVGGAPVSPVVS